MKFPPDFFPEKPLFMQEESAKNYLAWSWKFQLYSQMRDKFFSNIFHDIEQRISFQGLFWKTHVEREVFYECKVKMNPQGSPLE